MLDGLGDSVTVAGIGGAPCTVKFNVRLTVSPVAGSVADAVTVAVPATS